ILSNAIMLNVVIGLTFTTLGLIFLDDILYFFGASDQTIPYARDFMRIILSGNVITHVFMGMNEILRASGYPKKAMGIMLTAVFIIVCLNPLFIFGFGWGVVARLSPPSPDSAWRSYSNSRTFSTGNTSSTSNAVRSVSSAPSYARCSPSAWPPSCSTYAPASSSSSSTMPSKKRAAISPSAPTAS
ncbi:MAG: MATE family efflux transporter, partial [Alistipes inops]